MKKLLFSVVSLLFFCICSSQTTQPNIIFIVVDDCNDWIQGFNGHPQTLTPNIAELETKGTTFLNAYCSAPQCGPSRTSFMTGKDVAYTQVYDNTTYVCTKFSGNFKESKGNEEYHTIPGYLKDSAGYYTYSIGKIFHCYDNLLEYDQVTSDPCARGLSWNKAIFHEDSMDMNEILLAADDGIDPLKWGHYDSLYIGLTEDNVSCDSAVAFINQVAIDPSVTCNKPFFLGFGIRKPHYPAIAPENFFLEDFYLDDIYDVPYKIPYNYPEGSTPFNGVVLPQEANPRFSERTSLPAGGAADQLGGGADDNFTTFPAHVSPYPVIPAAASDSERNVILEKSQRANAILSYLANIRFADSQVGKLMDALEANPALYSNTIIVLIGDHGFSLGEHQHWQKQALWETDIRAPLIIADLRSPVAKVSTRMASFLDLFPTICDYAGVDYPTFEDGTDYLDGISLYPTVTGTPPVNERPLLSTIKNSRGKPQSCYPQYSVRNNRFHLLKYNPDNVYGVILCDSASAPVEEELYELGANKEVDPNEFHNLAYLPEYKPVRDYLAQFLPGGDMYLQTPMKVQISLKRGVPCFYDDDDLIKLRVTLYNENGFALPATSYGSYTITWTNNLTPDTFTGKTYNFPMSILPADDYTNNDRIIFYVSVKDGTGKQLAFDIKYVYINPANTPVVSFSTAVDHGTVSIVGYTLTGSYNNSNWTYGDGTLSKLFVPGPHTYSTTGNKTIRNYVYYGNGCVLYVSRVAHLMALRESSALVDFLIYPNPAKNSITVIMEQSVPDARFLIINQLGEIVRAIEPTNISGMNTAIDIADLPNGMYFMKIESSSFNGVKAFEVIGK